MTDLWMLDLADPGLEPDVSVIICAHGKWEMTLECIRALERAQAYNLARMEIILVDDASPDATAQMAQEVKGIRLVQLTENVGFLRAANAGAARASGRNLLFLNNDTLPQGAWLDPLIDLFEQQPRAGVVGSRLVNNDGTIQEAGGIIFSDGSGWNYGRNMAADDPRVRFARQVDYCSGASLLVRSCLWRDIGGFDESLAPAYYEDTDLAFAARSRGWEVWYQPASIVVHLEGQSHGSDETSGVKRFQVVNHEKFRRKWAQELVNQFPPEPSSVPNARQRTTHGRIVVFENEVPTPDLDAGSSRLIELMQAMMRLGHAVTFVPVNGWRRPRYTGALEALGIEVLGAPDQWWGHLAEMADSVSHVWVARPHVAAPLVERLRATFPSATLVYDTVDLHFLRTERKAAVLGAPEDDAEARRLLAQEMYLIETADVTVVVSTVEAELLSHRTSSRVTVVPTVHPDQPRPSRPAGRSGLLFVGGFQHSPNGDAVQWFVKEVLPIVRANRPDVVLRVVGSKVPSEIQALAGDGVQILGWVPDITTAYAEARLAVAPLRYGAGVKGKVGEAMSLGVPIVLTSVAAEGLHLQGGVHAAVADDAPSMAEHILVLLDDDDRWRAMSDAARQLIQSRFSPRVVQEALAETLAPPVRADASVGDS
jgi:O-antigen biosynthesis protein